MLTYCLRESRLPHGRRSRRARFSGSVLWLDGWQLSMVSEEVLRKVKPSIRIVNVSRGSVIDESALIVALKRGQLRSVALDVLKTSHWLQIAS